MQIPTKFSFWFTQNAMVKKKEIRKILGYHIHPQTKPHNKNENLLLTAKFESNILFNGTQAYHPLVCTCTFYISVVTCSSMIIELVTGLKIFKSNPSALFLLDANSNWISIAYIG